MASVVVELVEIPVMLIKRYRDSEAFSSTDFYSADVSLRPFEAGVLGGLGSEVDGIAVTTAARRHYLSSAKVNVRPVRMAVQNFLNLCLFLRAERTR
jgi:hypothetical protein